MKTKYLIFILLAAFAGSACSPQGEPYKLKSKYEDKPSYGDILIDSTIGEPSTLNPVLASDSASSAITGLVFSGLVKYDKDMNIIGDLAESFSVSPDGLSITFKLRRGVKWHDGAPFTARDVKFTYEKFIDPNVKTAYSGLFEPVKNLEIIDDYTVRVNYKYVFAPGLQYWGMEIIPYHLLKGQDINKADFNRAPVGTGPYIFERWVTASKIELRANKEYFDGEPYISRYIYRVIPDQSVQFMELKAGAIDMMALNSDLYFTKASGKSFEKNFNKYAIPARMYVYMGFNMTNPIFKDAAVRRAINYAIDKEGIITGVRRGLAKRITGPFIPGTYAYNDKAEAYDYNPEKASALLAESGWRKGASGILEKNGEKLKFTIYTNQGNKEREQIAAIIQEQLSQIGIKADIRIMSWPVLLAEKIEKKKFDAVVMGWSLSNDPDCHDIWHSAKTREGEFNFVSYANAEVDKLLKEGRTTFDTEKRKKAYNRIHELIAADAPYVFLYSPLSLPAVHKRIHGIKPEPAGISYNFTKWYVPEELIKHKP